MLRSLCLITLVACADSSLTGSPDLAVPVDDQLPPAFFLTAPDPTAGEPWTVSVEGAQARATVDFYYSLNGTTARGARIPAHGGIRSGLVAPASLLPGGRVVADDFGTATLTVPVPATMADGTPIAIQAFSGRTWLSDPQERVVRRTCAEDGLENNDLRAAATSMPADDLSHLRSCPGDDDWFEVWLDEGDELTVELQFQGQDADIDMELYRPGDLTFTDHSNGTGDYEGVHLTATAAGYHVIHVYMYQDAWAPGVDYTMSIQTDPAPPVAWEGEVTLGALEALDLDSGRTYTLPVGNSWFLMDLEWGLGQREHVYTDAGGGLAPMGVNRPSYQDCQGSNAYNAEVVDDVPARGALIDGAWLCARTGDGRTARLQVVQFNPTAGTLQVDARVWEDPGAQTVYAWGSGRLAHGAAFDFGYGVVVQPGAPSDIEYQADPGNYYGALVPVQGAQVACANDPWHTYSANPVTCEGVAWQDTPLLMTCPAVCVRTRDGQLGGLMWNTWSSPGDVYFDDGRWN